MKLIEAHGIAHHFDYPLFSNVAFDLDVHELVAIIGISGSGKSTLLHILSTLLEPDEGEISLLGRKIVSLKNRDLVELRRRELGMIFQSHYLFKGFSAYENLEVAAILSQEPVEDTLLEALGIADVMGQKVTELSGGQQQRVSIARVLTKKPRIVFADEPTGNLDRRTADEVMALFEDYIARHEAGMVLVTHDEPLAMRCDRVLRLENQGLSAVK